jgi:hypothetical protein
MSLPWISQSVSETKRFLTIRKTNTPQNKALQSKPRPRSLGESRLPTRKSLLDLIPSTRKQSTIAQDTIPQDMIRGESLHVKDLQKGRL